MSMEPKQNKNSGKSRWRWAALAAAVLGGVMLALEGIMALLAWVLSGPVMDPDAVGLIGGADGPTAIIVATTTTTGVPDWVIWALLLVLGLVGWRRLNRCRK